eukprot:TRINITY_DN58847_c0_g1_i1.p2 TRINITY_DN58847_c0_g1~~TRINITY_DN58847_c0_g1_i1.p2  ORF type:complete len:312 (+),score=98.36 TRINITY_DN58847_c0_g1_i1:112-1047(+)
MKADRLMRKVRPHNLIQPLFMHGGVKDEAIGSMPGMKRLTRDSLIGEVRRAHAAGVYGVALFPKVDDELKCNAGAESWNPEGLVPEMVRAIKQEVPGIKVITDVALDPYSSMGQDGIVHNGEVHNDLTLDALVRQAACHVEAGADIVAPSDMMDGRIGAIRSVIGDDAKIMSYAAKYASAFYGPFRDALDSAPMPGTDKKTYQMNPGNSREALSEALTDIREGADYIMVKPGLPYLDIVSALSMHLDESQQHIPLAVYHVSGEYAMLNAAVEQYGLDEGEEVLKVLHAFRRAGAELVLTYYATRAAEAWCA